MREKPEHVKKLSKRKKTDLNPVHRQPKRREVAWVDHPTCLPVLSALLWKQIQSKTVFVGQMNNSTEIKKALLYNKLLQNSFTLWIDATALSSRVGDRSFLSNSIK